MILAASNLEPVVVLLQAEPGHACWRSRLRRCLRRRCNWSCQEEYDDRRHKIGSNHVYFEEGESTVTKMRYLTFGASSWGGKICLGPGETLSLFLTHSLLSSPLIHTLKFAALSRQAIFFYVSLPACAAMRPPPPADAFLGNFYCTWSS